MELNEIIGRYVAIYTTAKSYHWKVTNKIFSSDHALFDEIAGVFDLGIIDTLVEINYMVYNRERLPEVYTIFDNFVNFKGKDVEPANSINAGTEMALELKRMCSELLDGLNTIQGVAREINVVLDDLSSKLNHALVLLNGRTAFSD